MTKPNAKIEKNNEVGTKSVVRKAYPSTRKSQA